jgi:orotate phosphoribosyltransferase
MTRDELARRIADVALLRGEFTLRSGRKSNYYLDKYRFETQPDCLLELGKMIAARIPVETQRIAGPELGAVPLAASAAMQCGKPCIFVRNQKKEYGSAKQVEGVFNAGEKIVLIEDIVTSGGQVIEAANSLKDLGLQLLKVIVVIDREEGGREAIANAGIKMESLFTTTDLGIQK